MNKETEQYMKTAGLLNLNTTTPPSDDDIAETIQNVKSRLEIKEINRFINAGVKEGYLKMITVLESRQKDLQAIDLKDMKTVQGRAIVALAIDYLNGSCSSYALLGIPIKER